MGRFLRFSDEEVSRLLAGEVGTTDDALEELALWMVDIRQASHLPPDETTRHRHIAAISVAAHLAGDKGEPVARPAINADGPLDLQTSGLPKWRNVMGNVRSIALKAAAGMVAVSLSTLGMAYAGVDLPGTAAERAIEAITGLELPNQDPAQSGEGKSVADDVHSVIDGDLEGCERGQAIADAAGANRQDDATQRPDPCDAGDANNAQGSSETGEEKSAEGRAKAAEASDGRSEARGSNGDQGRETAAEHSDGASNDGSSNGASASEAGKSNRPTDPGRGNEASGSGQGNKPTDVGRP